MQTIDAHDHRVDHEDQDPQDEQKGDAANLPTKRGFFH